MPSSADLVVLGAGPAGLATALAAARRGCSVVVLERASHVGGLAASMEVGGQRVDLGSHRLHPSMPTEVRAELDHLLGEDLQVRPRRGRIRLEGRWLAFPLRPGDLLRHAPPGLTAGFLRDLAVAPVRRPRGDSFAALVRAGLGPTVADRFYLPYARKLWATEPEELTGELYRRRVSAGSTGALVRRVLQGARPAARTFLYPCRGFGQLAERLADAAVASGVDLRLGCPAERLVTGDHQVTVTTPRGQVEGGHVVATIPAGVVVGLLDPVPPPEITAAAACLRHRGALVVHLVLDRPRWTPFDAHYLPEPAVPVARLSEPKNYRDGPDPPGRTVLCAEVPATPGDHRWGASDAAVVDEVVDALARCGLPPAAPVHAEVRRVPHVYPVYARGHEEAQATLESWVGRLGRCTLVGRQALFAHDNTHHALTMGWAAGSAASPGGRFDAEAWSLARDAARHHVVED